MTSEQAKQIRKVGSQAPYGKGSETIVDTAVRNTIQIQPSLITISSQHWQDAFKELLRSACAGLGVKEDRVSAELYKLLLYEEGSHFKPHVDSEKVEGMFGTLVIQFPSSFSGGTVLVRHNGIERIFPLGVDDGSCSKLHHFVAHYADCEHEVREVTTGSRLVAVYSLVWVHAGPLPQAPDENLADKLARALRAPEYRRRTLGALMLNSYTARAIANLGIRALKHQDRAVVGTLLAASRLLQREGGPDDELVLHLAKVYRETEEDTDWRDEDFDMAINIQYVSRDTRDVEFQIYSSDGRPRTPHEAGLNDYHFRFSRDVVNRGAVRTDKGWDLEDEHDTGNEGTIYVYGRWLLTFCPRFVFDRTAARQDFAD